MSLHITAGFEALRAAGKIAGEGRLARVTSRVDGEVSLLVELLSTKMTEERLVTL